MIEAVRVTRPKHPYGRCTAAALQLQEGDARGQETACGAADPAGWRAKEFGRKGQPRHAGRKRFVGVHPRPEPPRMVVTLTWGSW